MTVFSLQQTMRDFRMALAVDGLTLSDWCADIGDISQPRVSRAIAGQENLSADEIERIRNYTTDMLTRLNGMIMLFVECSGGEREDRDSRNDRAKRMLRTGLRDKLARVIMAWEDGNVKTFMAAIGKHPSRYAPIVKERGAARCHVAAIDDRIAGRIEEIGAYVHEKYCLKKKGANR
jgi:hypothetical protein